MRLILFFILISFTAFAGEHGWQGQGKTWQGQEKWTGQEKWSRSSSSLRVKKKKPNKSKKLNRARITEKKIEKVKKILKGITYLRTNGKQKPSATLRKMTGNCLDTARLASYLLKGEGIRSKVVIERTSNSHIKHAVVIYSIDGKKYRISNGNFSRIL